MPKNAAGKAKTPKSTSMLTARSRSQEVVAFTELRPNPGHRAPPEGKRKSDSHLKSRLQRPPS